MGLNATEAPSRRAIAKATGIALLVALAILFTAVLPAEYGIDPLKTGARLGLTQLAKAAEPKPAGVPVSTVSSASGQSRVFTAQPAVYKVDTEDLTLRPNEGVEIKYHMLKGAGMVYAWKATGKIRFEFHGEPDQKPNKDYFESYELEDKVGRDHAYGSFTAPSTGIHGWFWENNTNQEISIHLTTAGFYDVAKMFAGGPPEDIPVEDVK